MCFLSSRDTALAVVWRSINKRDYSLESAFLKRGKARRYFGAYALIKGVINALFSRLAFVIALSLFALFFIQLGVEAHAIKVASIGLYLSSTITKAPSTKAL